MKFYGEIGFAITRETAPGVYMPDFIRKNYYGDVISNNRRLQDTVGSTNDSVTISNEFSILADPFANENFHSIRYITYLGIKWKVANVNVEYPRLVLTVGGEYNGDE